MIEERVDERAVGIAGSWVDDHARRLVDDDQICILEADIEPDRLRPRRRIFYLRENYDEILVVSDTQRGVPYRRALLSHVAGFDQPLEPGARQLREVQRQ